MKSIYSPRQIQAATFLGGPFAAAYFLKTSFESINKQELASKSFIVSLIVSVIIIGILPFLPERMPNNVLPLLYLIPVVVLLKKHYFTKEEILASEVYEIESNWKVFGISLASVFLFSAIAIPYLMVSQSDDDVAQYLVDNINNSNFEVNSDYYLKLEAQKDPNGSGVLLNLTLNNSVIYDFEEAEQEVLRPIMIDFFGKDNLRDLADNNVYIIVNFQTLTGQVVNKVVLSPSNIKSD